MQSKSGLEERKEAESLFGFYPFNFVVFGFLGSYPFANFEKKITLALATGKSRIVKIWPTSEFGPSLKINLATSNPYLRQH